jgi:hypothetical protein
MPEMTQSRALNISTSPAGYSVRELVGARTKLLESIVHYDAAGDTAMADDLRFCKQLLEHAIDERNPFEVDDDGESITT